jgi:hypothetical protein
VAAKGTSAASKRSAKSKSIDLSSLSPEVAMAIVAYHPKRSQHLWAQYSPMLIELLIQLAPATAFSAKRSLRSMFGLVSYRVNGGNPVKTVEDFFTAPLVESYIADRRANPSKATTKNKQIQGVAMIDCEASQLRTIGRILNPASNWPTKHQGGKARPLSPIYSDSEILKYFEFATQMSNPQKKRIAVAAMSLSLGAGLNTGQLHRVLVEDITCDDEEVTWVKVRSKDSTERLVPVSSPWDKRLWQVLEEPAKRFNEWALPIGRSKDCVGENLTALSFGKKNPPISVERMRNTWLIHRLIAGAWPPTLAQFAGLSTLHSIFKVMASLPEQPADQALASMLRYLGSGQ